MSEGALFAGLDLANAKDNPFITPTDWYTFISSKVEMKPNKDKDKLGLFITWTIVGGDYDGNNMLSWNRVPTPDMQGKELEDCKSWLKMFLLTIGVPESKQDSITAQDLLNIRAEGMCHESGGFTKPSFREDKDEFRLIDNPNATEFEGSQDINAGTGSDSEGMDVFAGGIEADNQANQQG